MAAKKGQQHICPDCGRQFASGAALGGHRRVHTKGTLTRARRGDQPAPRRRAPSTSAPRSSSRNNIVQSHREIALEHGMRYQTRTSPEPYNEHKYSEQYVTDTSSEEEDGDISDKEDASSHRHGSRRHHHSAPILPPLKKRKLNAEPAPGLRSGPSSIGYVVKPPAIKRPSKMDAIREQIGLAMALYHFNVSKLAEFCNVPTAIFAKWLQGGIDQKADIGVNQQSASTQSVNASQALKPSKPKKTPIFKIKLKRSRINKANASNAVNSNSNHCSSSTVNGTSTGNVSKTESAFYLTPILADQIAEKMKKWLDAFIANGFIESEFLDFVHHFKRYKRNDPDGGKGTAICFDNLEMKFNKIEVKDEQFKRERNHNPTFDWNDDSSFYYNVDAPIHDVAAEGQKGTLIPIRIDDIVRGKPFHDEFLWNPTNGVELKAFIGALCNDLKEGRNEMLKERLLKSAESQIAVHLELAKGYKATLDGFASKQEKRGNNYFQHLSHKLEDDGNIMFNIADQCHGHILIKIKVNHGKIRVKDQFLWNINSGDGEIEGFARTLCADQGLPFLFAPSIAIDMRTQINEYKVKMTKAMKLNNTKRLNEINDPISHEMLRFVGRKRSKDLKHLKQWEPTLLVHKPPNRRKTKVRDT